MPKQGRRVSVKARCRLYRDGALLGKYSLRFSARAPDAVAAALVRALSRHTDGGLRCPHLHQYKVTRLRLKSQRGGGDGSSLRKDMLQRRPGSASWPGGVKSISVSAVAHVTSSTVPEELQLRVASFPHWPTSHFLTAEHKVRCGCEDCSQRQANGGVDEDGVEVEPRQYRRRRAGRQQPCGYWTPANFIQHVCGVKFGGGRQPAGVPPLQSQRWLTFLVPGPREGAETVELGVSDLTSELGYRWQPRKEFVHE